MSDYNPYEPTRPYAVRPDDIVAYTYKASAALIQVTFRKWSLGTKYPPAIRAAVAVGI